MPIIASSESGNLMFRMDALFDSIKKTYILLLPGNNEVPVSFLWKQMKDQEMDYAAYIDHLGKMLLQLNSARHRFHVPYFEAHLNAICADLTSTVQSNIAEFQKDNTRNIDRASVLALRSHIDNLYLYANRLEWFAYSIRYEERTGDKISYERDFDNDVAHDGLYTPALGLRREPVLRLSSEWHAIGRLADILMKHV